MGLGFSHFESVISHLHGAGSAGNGIEETNETCIWPNKIGKFVGGRTLTERRHKTDGPVMRYWKSRSVDYFN